MDKLKPGTRIIDTRSSCRTGIILAHTDCKIVNKYPEGTPAGWNEKSRAQYTWVEFNDGGINGWRNLPYYISQVEKILKEKRDDLLAQVAEITAQIEEAARPKAGDKYQSDKNNLTATVKFVDDEAVYYSYKTSAGSVIHKGRPMDSFKYIWNKKLEPCGC